jgi:hypothetical protein
VLLLRVGELNWRIELRTTENEVQLMCKQVNVNKYGCLEKVERPNIPEALT